MLGRPDVNARNRAARAALTAFLKARRARLRPQDVGLQRLAAQLSPGLTRAHVARLAGITTNWYAAIESGRARGVSETTIVAIARALRLTPSELKHLRRHLARALERDRD